MKPLIELGDFQHLDLRIGTVVEVQRLDSMDLVAANIEAGERVAALLPASTAARLAAGSRVVVAVGLHPLAVSGAKHTGFVIAALSEDVGLADGSRVS
ncbi:MAG TPA: hypothetical protein VE974_10795 [Thermoanaerobaculia bacterium]|nr:hypothetical protein [Thermoanaerobaculia bacterium]